MDKIGIRIAGTLYTGWKSAVVTRSIETCCGSFTATIVTFNELQMASLVTQAPCDILIGDDKVIHGYIDNVKYHSDVSGGRYFTIKGRDITSDIVDSSVSIAPFSWKSINLYTLAKKLCDPHGVKVVLSGTSVKNKVSFSVETGEGIFDALSRFAKSENLLILTTENGDLLIDSVGSSHSHDPLVYEKNLKSVSVEHDAVDRFSEYIVKAQKPDNKGWGTGALTIFGKAKDEEVRAGRIKIINATGITNNTVAKSRALWEASARLARSEVITGTVVGFRQSDYSLWRENKITQVIVRTPEYELSMDMVISSVSYNSSDDGNTTGITLKRVDAFSEFLKPVVKKKTTKKSGFNWKI